MSSKNLKCDETVYNCYLCAYKTEHKVDFESHLTQHCDNICVICKNTFMTAELLDQHNTEQHGSFVQVIKHEEIDSSDHLATDNETEKSSVNDESAEAIEETIAKPTVVLKRRRTKSIMTSTKSKATSAQSEFKI